MDLSNNYIQNLGASYLGEGISKLRNLNEFYLDLSNSYSYNRNKIGPIGAI